nr:OpgC domain-containing protein [Oharaeibacter diazotrophicus]
MPPVRAGRVRDPRLDFFRGVGMYIILVAHIPENQWTLWIPARFGFSDATEIFVFLSGIASAIAFGSTFDRAGFRLGVARVAQRIWQVYWAHVCVFVAVLALLGAAGTTPSGQSYVATLNLQRFAADPAGLAARFLTLTYVPNYFDILPMYLVMLAMMPAMLALERIDPHVPLAVSFQLWLLAQFGLLDLPAEPWSDRPWFFDPFGWQLLFFLGFSIRRGLLRPPAPRPALVAAAVAVVVLSVPFAWYAVLQASPTFAAAAAAIEPLTRKTDFGALRLVHFLAVAWLAWALVPPTSRLLAGRGAGVVRRVGQQSLAVFVAGMVVAQALGILLDHLGRGPIATAAANLLGFAVLTAVAHVAGWFKSAPWKG